MSSDRAHKGSALLIVLGMLAFMVVSAVAFSAFMRSSRLPSSYLRRSISSRMLVKAALAQAIDEIDAAIGDHPHPGVWKNQSFNDSNNRNASVVRLPEWEDGNRYHNMNAWLGRVYIGGTTDVARVQDRLIEQYETVPVLSLEALAYIPPSLVNDARYYSRHTPSATWHSMGFDAGRYAFCALDVSDFFDINVMRADTPRSTNPDERISLNYLFESADHSSAASGADSWQNFIDGILDSKVPFVSMADWNLAVRDQKFGGDAIQSYFYQYAKKGSTLKDFYQGKAETEEQKEMLSRMSFVTDGWFPPKEQTAANQSVDISDEKNQPFSKSDLEQTPSDFVDSVMLKNEGSTIWTKLQESVGKLTKCALWDYLDKDDVPLSLAMPTLERTPMICGLSPEPVAVGGFSVNGSVEGKEVAWSGTPGPGAKCKVTYKVKYDVSGFPDVHLKALTVFPFRNKIPNEKSYEIGGRVSLFLSEVGNDVRLRTGGSDILHLGYQSSGNPTSLSSVKMIDNSVIVMPVQGSIAQPSSFDGAANGEEGAVKQVSLRAVGKVPVSVTFLTATYEWETVDTHTKDDWTEGAEPIPQQSLPDITKGTTVKEASCNLFPLDANGVPSSAYKNDIKATLQNAGFAKKLKLNVAVWAWIRSTASNKIVDLVPACVQDDVDINQLNQNQALKVFGTRFGTAYPLMRFDLGEGRSSVISFNSAACNANVPGVVAAGDTTTIIPVPKTAYIGDPRYNHAPESWYYVGDSDEMSESEWLKRCGAKSRDGDIFMMTSDQCVLQSVYEFANLPRLDNDFYLKGSTKTMMGNYLEPSGADTQIRQAASGIQDNLANANLMWKTYDPLPNSYNAGGDDFDNAGLTYAGGGYKINPYSSSTNVIMAAFANTPLEWRFSADPNLRSSATTGIPTDAKQFNAKYAWNEYSTGANIDYADLEALAGQFMGAMRLSPLQDWQDTWSALGWSDAAKKQSGTAWEYLTNLIKLGNTDKKARIYNCDRKFLYGFWHDCFAARQQLFLVFVRAEPMLMGGASVNSVPPQLGARAVALVWRDPERADNVQNGENGVPPHRTRVLFYRQLE